MNPSQRRDADVTTQQRSLQTDVESKQEPNQRIVRPCKKPTGTRHGQREHDKNHRRNRSPRKKPTKTRHRAGHTPMTTLELETAKAQLAHKQPSVRPHVDGQVPVPTVYSEKTFARLLRQHQTEPVEACCVDGEVSARTVPQQGRR